MELFKSEILKKEFKEFSNKLIVDILECNYCNKNSCKYHSKFVVSCLLCRNAICKKCKAFNTSKYILLKSAQPETVDYLINYICDFLNLSEYSIQSYFPGVKVEKVEKTCYKTRVKSEKCSQKTVKVALPSNIRSSHYQHGRWKRKFYY